MKIEKNQTNGCDKLSRVYSNMYNLLEEVMHDEEKFKELSPFDFSAMGLYIGKFVEQEINSSVVQILRKFRGVPMPKYYCKHYRHYVEPVITEKQTIFLNSWIDRGHPNSLKTISIGDAYYALDQLKREDCRDFFKNYPWMDNPDFLNAWLELSRFRNKMAHIGEIIDKNTLIENYNAFQVFLHFLPEINQAKIELTPLDSEKNRIKTTMKIAINCGCCGRSSMLGKGPEDDNKIITAGEVKVFKQREGMRGIKDVYGKIIVPAKYDDFGFVPNLLSRHSVVALRDGKNVLVALDGSGRELTTEIYDVIRLADSKKKNSPYVYQKKGRLLWGIMDDLGNEICGNIIENYICKRNSLWYVSGELWGIWNYGQNYPFLPPIYDNIEIIGKSTDAYSGDSRSPIPMISVHSVDDLLYRRQS